MKPRVSCTVAAILMLAGCADDSPSGQSGSARIATTSSAAPTRPTAPTAPTAPAAPTAAPDVTSTSIAARRSPEVGNPRVSSVEIGSFDAPIDLVTRPGDSALFVVEQPGRVVRLTDADRTIVADITDRTRAGGEQGLLGLEFSIDGRLAYLDYTNAGGDTVIAEYPVDPTGRLDVDAERTLLTVDQPFGNHNAGDLALGPDGMLYITLGDGGSANDPERAASDPSVLLGSLLRIDPRPDREQPYTIPPDNPFADGPFDDVVGAPEVWAWGLRNPWKIAFDPVTGDLWIADVGQNEFEEVNLATPVDDVGAGRGADFGWSGFEGDARFNTDVPDADPVPPVLTYRHGDDGCSISGGVPYRGAAIPELSPAYVYSDYCSGIVWALDIAGRRNLTLLDGFEQVSAVRAGPDGELYVLELSGAVHRLIPG